jgi:hypothetical protein
MDNIFIGLGFIIIIVIVMTFVFKSENFSNIGDRQNINQEQLENLCGTGTKAGYQECVPDTTYMGNKLIENKLIREIGGDIVFTPNINADEIVEVPKWFYEWTDNSAYSCQKTISDGICNINGNNCNAPCVCGDCAGWRGGNLSDCNNDDIGGGRVFCNIDYGEQYIYSEDKCECSYGHCAVNGLCVSPYVMDGTRDNKRCCPGCAFTSPDKLGGCSGGVMCDSNTECDEAVVELPGWIKFNPNLTNNKVVKVDTLCSDINSTEECYHPDHVNAMKRQEYILVKPDSSSAFSSLCPEDTNTASGENEYECALKCGDTNGVFDNDQTVDSQVDCSKRCLPKLWRWYPVFEKLSDTSKLRYTGGYYQSDELMRYLDSDIELRICPKNTCQTELNESISFPQFNNCTECTECTYTYSGYDNNNGFKDVRYNCGSCKQCILDQEKVMKGWENIVCKNMVDCNTCKNAIQELDIGKSFNECDTCEGAASANDGCKVYTLDPYVDRGTSIDYHLDSKIYNHGGDPYDQSKNQKGYDPNSRQSYCGDDSKKKTCDNTLYGEYDYVPPVIPFFPEPIISQACYINFMNACSGYYYFKEKNSQLYWRLEGGNEIGLSYLADYRSMFMITESETGKIIIRNRENGNRVYYFSEFTANRLECDGDTDAEYAGQFQFKIHGRGEYFRISINDNDGFIDSDMGKGDAAYFTLIKAV